MNAVQSTQKIWTEAEIEALPDDGYIHEVVDGKLIMSPKNSFLHGDISSRLFEALAAFARAHRLGVVVDSSTGFWMSGQNCRAPDISFVAKQRLLGLKRPPSAFFQGAPDLAVEILSPSNTRREITERLEDYFSNGTRLAWLIHPEEEFVEACLSSVNRRILGPSAHLDGGDLLPGFKYPIADLFREWNWE